MFDTEHTATRRRWRIVWLMIDGLRSLGAVVISALSERCPKDFSECDDLTSAGVNGSSDGRVSCAAASWRRSSRTGRSHRVHCPHCLPNATGSRTRDLFSGDQLRYSHVCLLSFRDDAGYCGHGIAQRPWPRTGAMRPLGRTWNASPQAAWYPLELNGQTIRQIAHVSIGGTRCACVCPTPTVRIHC